jgi:hypothetical protein
MHRARLEQARLDVHAFFDRLRSQVQAERDQVQTAAGELADRQSAFRRDRNELEAWFAAREGELADRLSHSAVDALQGRVAELQQERTALEARFLNERLDAERMIRELIEQLSASSLAVVDPAGPASPAIRGAA